MAQTGGSRLLHSSLLFGPNGRGPAALVDTLYTIQQTRMQQFNKCLGIVGTGGGAPNALDTLEPTLSNQDCKQHVGAPALMQSKGENSRSLLN